MSTKIKTKVATQAEIQKAKFANAFDTICDHYTIDLEEYQNEKFEIGCEFAEHIHPLVAKNARFWEYWGFLWNMESLWIAQNLGDVGKKDYYDLMRDTKKNDMLVNNAINYINRTNESITK